MSVTGTRVSWENDDELPKLPKLRVYVDLYKEKEDC